MHGWLLVAKPNFLSTLLVVVFCHPPEEREETRMLPGRRQQNSEKLGLVGSSEKVGWELLKQIVVLQVCSHEQSRQK